MAGGKIEVKKEMIIFHQKSIFPAESIIRDAEINQDTIKFRARRNDMKVTIFENMVTLDPGSEKDVPLQPTYSESGVIKGVNSIEEGCESDCEDRNSSNIETEY